MKLRTHALQRSAWYAAAMGDEVTRKPMRRIILGDPVVFFRTRAGEAETEALVAELTAHCCQPQFVYSHCWTPGDIIVWDNRSTLHRGRPADPTERRVMRRTAAFGEGVEGPEVQVVG